MNAKFILGKAWQNRIIFEEEVRFIKNQYQIKEKLVRKVISDLSERLITVSEALEILDEEEKLCDFLCDC